MAFLFSTSFYLLSILVHSLSQCYSIQSEAFSGGWNLDHGTLIRNSGIKTGVSTFSEVCNKLNNHARGQKIICILCKGFDPSCFAPPTTTTLASTTSTTTSISTTTTPATTTTTTTAAPSE